MKIQVLANMNQYLQEQKVLSLKLIIIQIQRLALEFLLKTYLAQDNTKLTIHLALDN